MLDDADIPRAARAITSSALLHSGQICMSTERVIVQKGAADTLVTQLSILFKQIKAGDPRADANAAIGALFTERSAENVIAMIKEAVDAGAELLVGDLTREGAVVQPHIVAGVKPGMRLWERESFGPGACPSSMRDALQQQLRTRRSDRTGRSRHDRRRGGRSERIDLLVGRRTVDEGCAYCFRRCCEDTRR